MRNEEMLLIPGPTPVVDSIYDAMSQETWSHTDPRFAKIYKDSVAKTREMFNNTEGEVIVFAASGTLGMEMALANTVKPGERILIISQGFFGDRFKDVAAAYGIPFDVVEAEWGHQVDPNMVAARLANNTYRAVTVTHADTSTGVAADLDVLVPMIKQHGALAIVDGVCATAAMEEDMGKAYCNNPEWTLDVVLTGSQKAIGVPPGLAIVSFSKTALAARDAMERVPGYYIDIKRWIPIMHDPTKYFATPAVNLVYAYNEGMRLVLEEGLEQRYRRHRQFREGVQAALAVYGMKALAVEGAAADTLTCALYPEGVNDAEFRQKLADKKVVVSGALAHLSGKAFRIGHMGNTTKEMLAEAIRLIGETLKEMGFEADIDAAVKVFNSKF
ncbi:alanine--glyoxylate aminotransferase family protein [Aciduricibacillus chroicocephali]|uniref:Alanine--glyoxylate aminotransferase family protein n=1 Tax=Aciduricibacillus chroicocephali TaxID=3054939 RepID=A0ABY9KT01_9BACI|nr:alanine--glyoxylate aminotransferase family protein [Bacillaceae bacterium 44XB]